MFGTFLTFCFRLPSKSVTKAPQIELSRFARRVQWESTLSVSFWQTLHTNLLLPLAATGAAVAAATSPLVETAVGGVA